MAGGESGHALIAAFTAAYATHPSAEARVTYVKSRRLGSLSGKSKSASRGAAHAKRSAGRLTTNAADAICSNAHLNPTVSLGQDRRNPR